MSVCIQCGAPASREVNVSPGGILKVPVCDECHTTLWSLKIKDGIASARQRGKIMGRPRIDEKTREKIRFLKKHGKSYEYLCKRFQIARGTVNRIVHEGKET
jgi:hypothetical protein